jgi:hypothetical protein
LVRERRDDLGLTQAAVAAAGGPSSATMRLIEGALQQGYQPAILNRLEDAIRWQRGSVRTVLDGGDPVPLERAGREPAQSPAPAGPDPSDVRLHLVEATDAALRTDADIIKAAIDAGTFTPADAVESTVLRQPWDTGRQAAEIANFRARVAAHDARRQRKAQLPGVIIGLPQGAT